MSIQIAGHRDFSSRDWRNAILYFLNGMWGNDTAVTHRPKIAIHGITLRFDPKRQTYYISGEGDRENEWWSDGEVITVNVKEKDGAQEVEHALVRFVRNDNVQRLILDFDGGHYNILRLSFVKGEKRGDLQVKLHVQTKSFSNEQIYEHT